MKIKARVRPSILRFNPQPDRCCLNRLILEFRGEIAFAENRRIEGLTPTPCFSSTAAIAAPQRAGTRMASTDDS